MGKYTLPEMPYAYDALEPHIDAQTMEIHHDRHHAAYTTNLNGAIEGTELDGQSIESITLNEVVDLFKLPRQVGQFEDKVVTVAVGRFGPYVRHDGKFVSLGEYDPMSIKLDTCVENVFKMKLSCKKTDDNINDIVSFFILKIITIAHEY